MQNTINRRRLLQSTGAMSALALAGCAHKPIKAAAAPQLPFYDLPSPLAPIRAEEDRVFRVTVCTRPFRAAGPRLELERINGKSIIHNYGHGGSGWSLSWGYANRVSKLAREAASGNREAAVVGAGALGLTSAIMLQRSGFKVTIYAREMAPYTRSSRATGTWTPDSRIAFANAAAPTFPAEWESIARDSFFFHQSFLGSAGTPVEWIDFYALSDRDSPQTPHGPQITTNSTTTHHEWLHLYPRIADLTPHSRVLPAGFNGFPADVETRQSATLMFNVAGLQRQLLSDFFAAGGRFEHRDFKAPNEIAQLSEPIIVNCPGYEARKLWSDTTITPVRGQISWLIPQQDARYSLMYRGLNVVARRDGIVLQMYKSSEDGWDIEDEKSNPAETHEAVSILQDLYRRSAVRPRV